MEVSEPEILYKDLSYKIIGICMDVHRNLGRGFTEVIYKDALEYELQNAGINYDRERKYKVHYKDIILPHFYYADFIIDNCIVLEAKAVSCFSNAHRKQTINCLAASGLRLGILINFGEDSLKYARVAL
jgi:GxxExxY protein